MRDDELNAYMNRSYDAESQTRPAGSDEDVRCSTAYMRRMPLLCSCLRDCFAQEDELEGSAEHVSIDTGRLPAEFSAFV